MKFVVGIIIVICLMMVIGYVSDDNDDDDNFPNSGLGILDDDEALSLWELSQL